MYGARFAEEERVIQRDGGNFVAWHLLSARTRLLSIYLLCSELSPMCISSLRDSCVSRCD